MIKLIFIILLKIIVGFVVGYIYQIIKQLKIN